VYLVVHSKIIIPLLLEQLTSLLIPSVLASFYMIKLFQLFTLPVVESMLSSAMSTGQLKAIYGQFMSQVSQLVPVMLGTVVTGHGFLGTFESYFSLPARFY
jgi:hypothetical protein